MDNITWILAISLAVFLFSTGVLVGADSVISDSAGVKRCLRRYPVKVAPIKTRWHV
jgi:hypothetical protein